MSKVLITGTGLFTPPHTITNAELVQSFNTYVDNYNAEKASEIAAGDCSPLAYSSEAFIEKASGIKQRYVMDKIGILDPSRMRPEFPKRPDDNLSLQCEMAYAAAEQALSQAKRSGHEIDAIYMACSNFERPYPAMSVELQAHLGAAGFAMDVNVACASAAFGFDMAKSAIQQGRAKCVLLVNPEICSAHLNFRDRDSHFIFGDACTATLFEAADQAKSLDGFLVIDSRLKTLFSNNIRNNRGFLSRTYPSVPDPDNDPDALFRQLGRKVFKEVTVAVSELLLSHLADNQIAPNQLKRLWLHQANASMNQLILSRVMGEAVSLERAPIILDRYANTSSAGSVIAFHLNRAGLASGDLGLLCAFGAGYSIGNVILQKI